MTGPSNDMGNSVSERDVQVLAAAEQVRAGASLETVRPDLREDVAATVEVLGGVEALGEAPSVEFATRLEASLLGAVDRARSGQLARAPRRWLGLGMMRLAAVLGAAVLALSWGGFAAVQASETTIPGDTLYPVKEVGEAVRVFFARGDGVTRIRIQQLVRRQEELEAALRRGDGARSVLRLEAKVAASTTQLVNAARRLEAAGNPAPASATLEAVGRLHDRIDVLGAAETRPEVARSLRRMSNYLEGQERELEGAVPPSDRLPAATATATPRTAPAGGGTRTPSPTRTPDVTATAGPVRDVTATATPLATPPTRETAVATPTATRVADGTATPVPTRTPTPAPASTVTATPTREASATPNRTP